MFYSFGYNQYNINKKAGENTNNSLHAELDCLKKLRKQNKETNVSVLVFRIGGNNDYLYAKPCDSCKKSIIDILNRKNYKLKHIYYTTDNKIAIF